MANNLNTLVAVLLVFSTVSDRVVDTLECYSCDHVDNISKCNNTTHCSNDESCFLDVFNGDYRLGCVSNKQCGGILNGASSIVGRSTYEKQNSIDLRQREVSRCFECCSTNICNIHICQHLAPTSCIDDEKADCAWMSSRFNICRNVHDAKTVCPRFCGLCALVDGNWGEWSSWSECDVSCANGTRTRSRSCTNPTPVSGGLECPGSSKEMKSCSFPPCSVTPTIAFRSHQLASASLSSNQILVFTTVTLNAGNGYNNNTGKFTAPLPGTYFFATQLCVTSSMSSSIYYSIVHNGNDIKLGTVQGNNFAYECYNVVETAVLALHDTVWIRSMSSASLYESNGYWNTFSGHLVHI